MGVTAALVKEIDAGVKKTLERENKVRAKKGRGRLQIKKFINNSGEGGPALYQRLVILLRKGIADKGGITEGDKESFCRFLRDHGGADEAASIERTYRYKYKPALLLIGGGRKNLNYKKKIEELFADGKFTPSDLRSDESRRELLNRLVQLPLRAGVIEESLHNLHWMLVLGKHAEDFGRVGTFKREILADILVVGRHALYRVGLDDEELKLAKEIEKLARDSDNTAWLSARLQANHLGFVHSRDMQSDGALAALKLFRKNKDISLAGFGKGRIFAYIAESFIHRGFAVDAAPPELGMSIRAAIEESHGAARANGDFDGAIRVRTVLARGYLWQEQWEKALQVTKDIWEEYRALERDLPQAEMRLRYKEYIIHLLAAKRGERNASEYASMSLNGALAASMRGGNTPILSINHKSEFKSLGERLGIKIDTGN